MAPFSVLDLSPIVEGDNAAQSFGHTVELAQHCERLGFRRYRLAEHHGMPGIAGAATAGLLGLLGPVVGNRLANTHVLVLKPHLRQRQALQACRSTPLGTVVGGPDGRLLLWPKVVANGQVGKVDAAPEEIGVFALKSRCWHAAA